MLRNLLKKYRNGFHPITNPELNNGNTIHLDLSVNNKALQHLDLQNTESLEDYIFNKIKEKNAFAGIGGYDEHRHWYQRSDVFDTDEGSRSIHIGMDIWMNAGTPVLAPVDSIVHSYKDNSGFGNYGPTIILEHKLENHRFYTLYGHLSKNSLHGIEPGKIIVKGQEIGQLGAVEENGNWPPHLHFQIIANMLGMKGDFPGVVAPEEREKYLDICPDPELILNIGN